MYLVAGFCCCLKSFFNLDKNKLPTISVDNSVHNIANNAFNTGFR